MKKNNIGRILRLSSSIYGWTLIIGSFIWTIFWSWEYLSTITAHNIGHNKEMSGFIIIFILHAFAIFAGGVYLTKGSKLLKRLKTNSLYNLKKGSFITIASIISLLICTEVYYQMNTSCSINALTIAHYLLIIVFSCSIPLIIIRLINKNQELILIELKQSLYQNNVPVL